MNQIFKIIWTMTLILVHTMASFAQNHVETPLSLGQITPYHMEVTYDKTSHLIFPSAVHYVDLGSEYLIAGKAEKTENVLRIKAAVKGFDTETNFSVVTEDGRFYSFNVSYCEEPNALSYDVVNMQQSLAREKGNDVLLEELGNHPPSLAGLLLKTIYLQNKKMIKHIGSKSFGIQFLLKGLYTHEGKYYFHTELKNNTNVPFPIDFVTFKIVDKKIAKRTVIQERQLVPLRMYKPINTVPGLSTYRNVFLLDQFTIADDKVLLIEVFEKNGGRNQVLQVENSDLIRACLISKMHLKFQ